MTSTETGAALLKLVAVIATMGLLVATALLPAVFTADRTVASAAEDILDVPPLPTEIPEPARTSFVRDMGGGLLGQLHGAVNRIPVPLEQVADVAVEAILATEDADFFRHNGVNHRAIVRAAVTNYQAGEIEEGASTITQQYVRNTLLTPEETIERKIREAAWAVELEKRLSKREILERYVNSVYFGNGAYGLAAASAFYFSKHPSELTAKEGALLAGLIRSPQENDPLDNPEAARGRRDIVLRQMAAQGFISDAGAEKAAASDLGLNVHRSAPVDPFFVEWVKRVAYDPAIDLQPELQKALGDTPEERQKAVFGGGLHFVTTLDTKMHNHARETLDEYLQEPMEDPLGAIVTLQVGSGAVRALGVAPKQFGNCPPGQKTCERTKVNPAVPGGGGEFGRQPGSSFKPFVVATALQHGFSPGWSTSAPSGENIPGCGRPDKPYTPANYGGASFGKVNMYSGIKNSVNVFAAKLAKAVGIGNVVETAQALGLRHSPNLDKRHFGPRSCAIGLGTANAYPLEMAVAYSTFANGGVRCDPYVVQRVIDSAGNVVYEHEPKCTRVLDPDVALRVVDILRGPPSPGGTAPYVGRTLDRPVFGKTGTTDDWVDAWFMGFVPQYATAAWVGYEQPESMFGVEAGGVTWPRVTGGTIPGRIWADYMTKALEDVPPKNYPNPQNPSATSDSGGDDTSDSGGDDTDD